MSVLRPITEKQFSRQVEQLARLMAWEIYHSWISIRSKAGFPDFVLVRPPRVLVIELKSDKGLLTSSQFYWMNLFARCPGIESYVWRPEDWKRIEEVLR
jgi:hypothetical protein